MHDKPITFVQLTPRQIYEDQLKIKNESEKRNDLWERENIKKEWEKVENKIVWENKERGWEKQ